MAAVPKAAGEERQRENLDVFGFELDAAAMAAIGGLARDLRLDPVSRLTEEAG